MIAKNDVRSALATCLSIEAPEELTDDQPIVVNSFALVWFQELMEERHGLDVQPTRSDLQRFASVTAVHAYLAETFPDRVAV